MSSFKRIKLLLRQGLPSRFRIRTAESDTDRMFVFPRLHSQHASARSERSCGSRALPTLFLWFRNGCNKKEMGKTGYIDYFRVCWQHSQLILALWSLSMSDTVWSPVGVYGGIQAAWNFIHAPLWQTTNTTHTFSARFDLIFSITPFFSKSKSSRKIISHMFEDFVRLAVHIIQ